MLNDGQLIEFAATGYLVIPGVVSEPLLAAADAEIDALLAREPPPADTVGKHFWFLPPSQLPCADAALRDSGALAIAEELVAPDSLALILDHIQIALNIPSYDHRPGGPHIDGHVRQQPDQVKPHSFTLLAGIFLTDETEIDQGSVWVWPGSHLVHQQLFRDRGTDVLMQNGGHITMLRDPPPLGAPVPVLGRRGDLLAGALPSRPQHGWQPQPHHTADAVLPARLPRPRRAVGTPPSSTPSRSTPPFAESSSGV